MATDTADLQDSQAPKMFAIFSVFLVLPLVVVGLRLISRRIARMGLWWDDWLILVATGILIANFVFLKKAIQNGAGRHVQTVIPSEDVEKFLIYTYANEIVYASIVTAIKSSILCFYLRIFGIDKGFVKIVYIFLTLVVAWGIATLLTAVFQCIPVSAAWNLHLPRSHCFNYRAWLIATNVPNIVIDFGILLLPMPHVWRLKLSTWRKISVSGVFLLGIFTSIVSIIRVHVNASFDLEDPTWNWVPIMIWSTIEGNTGILCACSPALAPLVRLLFGYHFSTSSGDSNQARRLERLGRSNSPHRKRSFTRLEEDITKLFPVEPNAVHNSISRAALDGECPTFQMNAIYVTNDVAVEMSRRD